MTVFNQGPTSPFKDWKVSQWLDQAKNDYYFRVEFTTIDGRRATHDFPMRSIDRVSEILAVLRDKGAKLPTSSMVTKNWIKGLPSAFPDQVNILAAMTGWDGDDFVMPRRTIGKRKRTLQAALELAEKSSIGLTKGTLKGWQKDVGIPVQGSAFGMFGVMLALAAPLLRYGLLPETAIFNLVGPTSLGKTTVAKVAASVSGPPADLPSWDATDRGRDEMAAAHNDLLMVLDDTEKSRRSKGRLADQLRTAAHNLTSGQSTAYAKIAAATGLPDLTWRALFLSSSPETTDHFTRMAGMTQTGGDRARLIDIPIPGAAKGGVVNRRRRVSRPTYKTSEDLISALEAGTAHQYGTLMPAWITLIAKGKVTEERVEALVKKFVDRQACRDGFEQRVARKFGLAYAAGRIAVDQALLPWGRSNPMAAAGTCYKAARRLWRAADEHVDQTILTLAEAITDPAKFPIRRPGGVVRGKDVDGWLGFRETVDERRRILIHGDRFKAMVGDDAGFERVKAALIAADALIPKTSKVATTQIRIKLGGRFQQPRFYILDPDNLTREAARIRKVRST